MVDDEVPDDGGAGSDILIVGTGSDSEEVGRFKWRQLMKDDEEK